MFVKLVDDDFGGLILFQPHGDSHAFPVGFVADKPDAFDLFVPDQFGNEFDELCLIDLIRQLCDHNGFVSSFRVFFDDGSCPQADDAAACPVGIVDTGFAVNIPGCREIRTGDDLNQLFEAQPRIVDDGLDGIDGLV